jgi:NADH dehydrogenase [ubiquinone] 1 alpha subcomplex assembly factor 5
VVVDRLLDRLEDCRRSFEVAVVLGGAGAQVAQRLAGGRAGIQQVVQVDTSQAMLDRARSHAHACSSGRPQPATRYVHWAPATEVLPLEPASADCELRAGCCHAVAVHNWRAWRRQPYCHARPAV